MYGNFGKNKFWITSLRRFALKISVYYLPAIFCVLTYLSRFASRLSMCKCQGHMDTSSGILSSNCFLRYKYFIYYAVCNNIVYLHKYFISYAVCNADSESAIIFKIRSVGQKLLRIYWIFPLNFFSQQKTKITIFALISLGNDIFS